MQGVGAGAKVEGVGGGKGVEEGRGGRERGDGRLYMCRWSFADLFFSTRPSARLLVPRWSVRARPVAPFV